MMGLGQPAAAIAGNKPERHADPGGDHDDDDRDFECAARAENDPRQQVAPEIVGAERKGGGGRFQALQQMRGGGILRMRRDPRAEQRDDHDREHDQQPGNRRQIAREFLQDQHVTAAPTAAGRASHAPGRSGC